MEIDPKTPPVYCYRGHFYYLGMRILPFYQWSSLAVNHLFQFNEILPFVEAHPAPNIFDLLLSQLHWKRGDKLADVMQTTEYPFYRIHRVDLVEGVIIAHMVLSWEDEQDAHELKASSSLVNFSCLPQEYALFGFQLRLVVSNLVRVTAGTHKGTSSVVLDLLVEEGYVQIIPHGGKNDQNVSWFHFVINSLLI